MFVTPPLIKSPPTSKDSLSSLYSFPLQHYQLMPLSFLQRAVRAAKEGRPFSFNLVGLKIRYKRSTLLIFIKDNFIVLTHICRPSERARVDALTVPPCRFVVACGKDLTMRSARRLCVLQCTIRVANIVGTTHIVKKAQHMLFIGPVCICNNYCMYFLSIEKAQHMPRSTSLACACV